MSPSDVAHARPSFCRHLWRGSKQLVRFAVVQPRLPSVRVRFFEGNTARPPPIFRPNTLLVSSCRTKHFCAVWCRLGRFAGAVLLQLFRSLRGGKTSGAASHKTLVDACGRGLENIFRRLLTNRRIPVKFKTSSVQTPKQTVGVAQLVESRIVIPVVVGSSPISHPRFRSLEISVSGLFLLCVRNTPVP